MLGGLTFINQKIKWWTKIEGRANRKIDEWAEASEPGSSWSSEVFTEHSRSLNFTNEKAVKLRGMSWKHESKIVWDQLIAEQDFSEKLKNDTEEIQVAWGPDEE